MSSEASRLRREEGNALYKQGKTREALKVYDESIALLAIHEALLKPDPKNGTHTPT